jgi:hypothetical protein
MRVDIIKYPTDQDWLLTRNNALVTQRKSSDKIPSSKLRKKFLISEHSPIRSLEFVWEWVDIPSWVATHFVRHHEGFQPYISSQRNDIQELYDRRKAPQDASVIARIQANAQAILNVSKARICTNASLETRQAWRMFLDTIKNIAPELEELCVPPCIYRNGLCPEVFKYCGYNRTNKFKENLEKYVQNFREFGVYE